MDAKGEQYVTQHLYSSFRVVIHLDDPPFGESNSLPPPHPPHSLKKSFSCVIQIRYTTLRKVVTVMRGIAATWHL